MRTFTCTRETPWTVDIHGPGILVLHPEAKPIGEQQDGYPGGDLVERRCPICGFEWTQELPQ